MLSPFCREDKDWKDSVGKHRRQFMAHFVNCGPDSQSKKCEFAAFNDKRNAMTNLADPEGQKFIEMIHLLLMLSSL